MPFAQEPRYFCNAKSVEPQCDGNDPTLYARAYIAGNVSGHGAAYTDYLNELGTDAPLPGRSGDNDRCLHGRAAGLAIRWGTTPQMRRTSGTWLQWP